MKDGHVMFLCVEELAGDHIGLTESAHLRHALRGEAGLGDFLSDVRTRGLADVDNQRPHCGLTQYLLLSPLETAGVTHHTVLTGHTALGPPGFPLPLLILLSDPGLGLASLRDPGVVAMSGAIVGVGGAGARQSVPGSVSNDADTVQVILRLALTVSVRAFLFAGNIGDIPENNQSGSNRRKKDIYIYAAFDILLSVWSLLDPKEK